MATPVQWTVDQFFAQLQSVKGQIDAASAALDADKARLGEMYATARANMDPTRDAWIAPLIHQNTVLRLQYLAPVRAKFNQAVAAARGALARGGITAPSLSGLGVLPAAVLVPAAAVVFLAACATAIVIVNRVTQAQITATATMQRLMSDPSTTVEQKLALAGQLKAQADALRKANPPMFDPSAFVAPLALLALVLMGPQLMRLLPQRRAAA